MTPKTFYTHNITMREIIERMKNRIMEHQKEEGFETFFDFLNEDLQELSELTHNLDTIPNIELWFREKYNIDVLGERLSLVEHKGSDVINFIREYVDDNNVKLFSNGNTEYYESLEHCCKQILKGVDNKKFPQRAITGLRLLLPEY